MDKITIEFKYAVGQRVMGCNTESDFHGAYGTIFQRNYSDGEFTRPSEKMNRIFYQVAWEGCDSFSSVAEDEIEPAERHQVKDRNLGEVLLKIIDATPIGHPMCGKLHSLMESLLYTAPEMITGRWNQLAEIVNEHITIAPDQLTGWQRTVIETFTGQSMLYLDLEASNG